MTQAYVTGCSPLSPPADQALAGQGWLTNAVHAHGVEGPHAGQVPARCMSGAEEAVVNCDATWQYSMGDCRARASCAFPHGKCFRLVRTHNSFWSRREAFAPPPPPPPPKRTYTCLFLQFKYPHHMCRLAKAASSGVQMLSLPAAPTNAGAAAPGSKLSCAGAASCRAFLKAYGNIVKCSRSQGPIEVSGQQPNVGVAVKQCVEVANFRQQLRRTFERLGWVHVG